MSRAYEQRKKARKKARKTWQMSPEVYKMYRLGSQMLRRIRTNKGEQHVGSN